MPARPWTDHHAPAHEPTDAEWTAALGDTPRSHRLTAEQLRQVQRAHGASGGDLDMAVRRLAGGHIDKLARRIRPTRGWGDIILTPDRIQLLHELVDRYRHADEVYEEWGFSASPSRGQVALFSGPSGTGKTLAAEVIAGELGLDLFKLDLSAVVSKYIGETEKNLDQVFDAAKAGNVVLFFDEADSLFGKRSEVKDARDRYANIEVSYLLQRIEAYDGLVILATNFERNIDDAFLRRIHVRVEFALPDEAGAQAIWEHNLPTTAPVGPDADIAFLAQQFELSGGSIRNAALQAAFLAAAGRHRDRHGLPHPRCRARVPEDGSAAQGRGLRAARPHRRSLTRGGQPTGEEPTATIGVMALPVVNGAMTMCSFAFYVKCDAETNPPESIDMGKVVVEVGIAPVKPAEFVIFRIAQIKETSA